MAEALLTQPISDFNADDGKVIVITLKAGNTYTLASPHSSIGILQIVSTGGDGYVLFRSHTNILTRSTNISFDLYTTSNRRWAAGTLSLSSDDTVIGLTSTYVLTDPIIISMVLL